MKLLIFSVWAHPEGDPRAAWAFDELVDRGVIEDYRLLSHMVQDPSGRAHFLSTVEKTFREYCPDIVLWFMDTGNDLPEDLVKKISRNSILVYIDLDPWQWLIKPTGRNQRLLGQYAHRVFVKGLGNNAKQFPSAGNRLRFFPEGYYDCDIPTLPSIRRRNLVFVGSVSRRWARVLGPLGPEQHPGRTKYVGVLRKRLGDRFVVHGKGYPRSWGIEPCEFSRQFTLSAENFATFANDATIGSPGYYSNRTSFALACGSLHIKIERNLDSFFFRDCPGIILVKNAEEAADAFEMACAWTDETVSEISHRTMKFAHDRLRMPDLYGRLLQEVSNNP